MTAGVFEATRYPRVERACLFILAALGGVVLIEPAPYEFFFVAAVGVFALTGGLRFPATAVPLLACLALFATGGLLALTQAPLTQKNVTFVAVSIYLVATALFFAMVLSSNAQERLDALRAGYVAGAVVASLTAILGQFDVAGLGSIFTLHGRASGTFKDPNVLGAFLVPAACFLLQDLLLKRGRLVVLAPAGLVMLTAVLLTFSRGAWANLAASAAMIVLATFILAGRIELQVRAIGIGLAALVLGALLLAALLSNDELGMLFAERARLDQAYDIGEQGRFGRQLRSLPVLLERPLGLGPFQFGLSFGEDPHNVYLNAFAAYGWLGGFAYFALILMTLVIALGVMTSQSPLQRHAIAIGIPFFVVAVQGLQIDTDHWRHVFLLIGCLWGLHAALRHRPANSSEL